jgi:glucose dehydrogenase
MINHCLAVRSGQRALFTTFAVLMAAAAPGAPLAGQGAAAAPGEWRYLGGDAAHTRYSPLDQIHAGNFEELEVAWVWRGDNFGPSVDYVLRSNPIFVDGILYTVAGSRRQVVAIEPGTGETLWTYREPHTPRYDRGMRNNYGKGVAYAEVDGRGVIFMTSPTFMLHALDAKTGRPLENWGRRVPLPGFPSSGVVDMVPDLVRDWPRWVESGRTFDPAHGIPREMGNISTSSPPIVVNGVVIIGNVSEQGYYQTRIENVPGDILAYDARTGEFLWKFNVIPRPGQFGHETWEDAAWKTIGDISSWAPMSADPERNLVFIPTNGPTIDFWGGHWQGDGLFSTSVIALDARTGERKWHYQFVKHDIWNYDTPTAPILLEAGPPGNRRPLLVQATKMGWAFTFDRETGEPIWPIEYRPVPAGEIPGEKLSPVQPFPTWPPPYDLQGLTEDDLIDFTPELRREALAILDNYRIGPIFNPPIQEGHPSGKRSFVLCPSMATNITHPPAADPTTGILYVPSRTNCRSERVVPGHQVDDPNDPMTTGVTVSEWAVLNRGDFAGPQGLPITKPPYSRITAIDMNTGEHLWMMPSGDTPPRIVNHPSLRGVDLPNTGEISNPIVLVTASLLISAPGATPVLYAIDKQTGERRGTIRIPAPGQYSLMTYLHEGRQYIVVNVAGGPDQLTGSLVALRLPR